MEGSDIRDKYTLNNEWKDNRSGVHIPNNATTLVGRVVLVQSKNTLILTIGMVLLVIILIRKWLTLDKPKNCRISLNSLIGPHTVGRWHIYKAI